MKKEDRERVQELLSELEKIYKNSNLEDDTLIMITTFSVEEDQTEDGIPMIRGQVMIGQTDNLVESINQVIEYPTYKRVLYEAVTNNIVEHLLCDE